MREAYQRYMDNPGEVETILRAGALKARQTATPFIAQLRHAVGLRDLNAQATQKSAKAAKTALPSFKQYREADGKFHFKLVDAQGRLLLLSEGFAAPKDAGTAIRQLQAEGIAALGSLQPADGVHLDEIAQALEALQAA
jgi:tryptophanyl-tRNA synthetase